MGAHSLGGEHDRVGDLIARVVGLERVDDLPFTGGQRALDGSQGRRMLESHWSRLMRRRVIAREIAVSPSRAAFSTWISRHTVLQARGPCGARRARALTPSSLTRIEHARAE